MQKEIEYIPYQLCPKCNGQGLVSRPPQIAGDVYEWSSGEAVHTCDVCQGDKIIPMHILKNEIICNQENT